MLLLELTERQTRIVRVLVQRSGREALTDLAREGTAGANRVRELTVIERKLTDALYGPSSRRPVRTEVPGQIDLLDLVPK